MWDIGTNAAHTIIFPITTEVAGAFYSGEGLSCEEELP